MWVQKFSKKYVRKGHIWNPATFCYENGRYAKNIINDSTIKCDELTETKKISIMIKTVPAKSIPRNLNEKKLICKMKKFYILLSFLLLPLHYQ